MSPFDWNHLPIIRASRVYLRPVVAEDADALFMIFSDQQVMRYWGTPPLADRNGAMQLVREIHDGFERRTMLKWGLALTDSDALIGTTTLFNLNLDNGRAEIGYCLGREHWGNGYMHEALQSQLKYAFETPGLRRLEADVDPRNISSIRTLERLGFQREGYLRERWHVNGEIQDTLFYGLLLRDWKMITGGRRT
jgi:RimJ/RimL family protein N-acetyltransferase